MRFRREPSWADDHLCVQCYLKTEAYGYAIRDATKAVELKPGFTKVRNLLPPTPLILSRRWWLTRMAHV